jgi:hypothetical protein
VLQAKGLNITKRPRVLLHMACNIEVEGRKERI